MELLGNKDVGLQTEVLDYRSFSFIFIKCSSCSSQLVITCTSVPVLLGTLCGRCTNGNVLSVLLDVCSNCKNAHELQALVFALGKCV